MNRPLISIVIPTFNSQKYLREAIESVINQSYGNLQILILDDGSSDNSVVITQSFADPRIELFESTVNKGQAYQLNKGIEKSKGEFVCIMHSDDVMHKNKLEEQLSFLNDNPLIGICGCNVQLIGEKSDTWVFPENNQDCKDLLLSTVPFAHPAVVIRKSVLNQMDYIYDQEMVPVEDYDLWVRLATKTDFGNVQKVLLNYRIHSDQIGNIEKRKGEKLIDTIRKKIICKLFKIDDVLSPLCFKSLYYHQEIEATDAIIGVALLWRSNKRDGLFSKRALKGRLKHLVYNILSRLTLMQRIKYILTNSTLFEISFFKTMARVFLLPKK